MTALLLAAAVAAAAGRCPLDRIARLGLPWDEAARRAAAAARAADPRCRAIAQLGAEALDDPATAVCSPAGREEALADAGADAQALRAALAWRCGRPREAFRAARRATRLDRQAALAWRVLGELWAARGARGAAREALRKALAIDPDDARSWWGLAGVAPSRADRRAALERYLACAPSRREPFERQRAAAEQIAFLDALGEREIFRRLRTDLPASIAITPVAESVGRISALLLRGIVGRRRRVPILLDSGAAGLHVAGRLARSAGLEPLAAGTLVGGGGGRRHSVTRGIVSLLDLGPLAFGDALAAAAPGDLHPRGTYRAILGFDLFSGLRVTLDVGRDRIELERGDPPVEPSDGAAWRERPDSVPLLRVEGQMLVPAELGEAAGAVPVLALIDTGASRSVAVVPFAALAGEIRRGEAGGLLAYGGHRALVGRLRRLHVRIADRSWTLRDVPVIAVPERVRMTGVAIGLFVGLDVLARQPVVFDLGRGELRFR